MTFDLYRGPSVVDSFPTLRQAVEAIREVADPEIHWIWQEENEQTYIMKEGNLYACGKVIQL